MYHGQKRYLQILLDPERAQLLDDLAEKKGVRTTAFVRSQIYEVLERMTPPEVYADALARDEAIRAASVRRQVAGRRKTATGSSVDPAA